MTVGGGGSGSGMRGKRLATGEVVLSTRGGRLQRRHQVLPRKVVTSWRCGAPVREGGMDLQFSEEDLAFAAGVRDY